MQLLYANSQHGQRNQHWYLSVPPDGASKGAWQQENRSMEEHQLNLAQAWALGDLGSGCSFPACRHPPIRQAAW